MYQCCNNTLLCYVTQFCSYGQITILYNIVKRLLPSPYSPFNTNNFCLQCFNNKDINHQSDVVYPTQKSNKRLVFFTFHYSDSSFYYAITVTTKQHTT